MINYEEYKKMIDYLNKEELEKLKEYIERERTKFYLKEARSNLKKYLKGSKYFKGNRFISELEDGRLLFSDERSLYVLNNRELLTPTIREECKPFSTGYISFAKKILDEVRELELIDDVYIIRNSDMCEVYSPDGELQEFNKENLSYAEKFLEGDVKYSLVKDHPICYVKSHKGEGVIMGTRNK